MGLHAHRPADSNPFLKHALDGWRPAIPHIRYPVTFGLYREGKNWGLFLAPADLACIRAALQIPPSDAALVMEGAQVLNEAFLEAPSPPRLIPWSEIDHLSGEVDLVHIPESAQDEVASIDLVTPVLAAPGRAVPTDVGSKIAIGLNDGCHIAVISPDLDLIQACLQGFIQDYIVSVMQRDTDLPDLEPSLVRELLVPMPTGEWCELMLHVRRRYWTLSADREGWDATPTQWVCEGESGRWRSGWSW